MKYNLKAHSSVEYDRVKLNRRYLSIDKIFNKSEVMDWGEYGCPEGYSNRSDSEQYNKNALQTASSFERNHKRDVNLELAQYSTEDLLLKPRK